MNLKSTTTNGFNFRIINSLMELWGLRLTWLDCKQIQQSLAEYTFSQNTDFIHSRVPGIAWNILRNVSLQFTGIFYLHLHPSLAKTCFLYQTGFLPGFKFSTSHFICVLNLNILLLILSESIDMRTRRTSISRAVLEIEANAVIYIHIIHAYILVFWVERIS